MAASALQSEHYLLVAPRNHLLRMLPPLSPPLLLLPHRRRRRSPAVRVSSGDGGSGEGFASAVEKRSVPEVVEEKGAERDGEVEVEVAGAPELKWPPWEGLAERYKLIGATSLAFVICNMDKDVPWRQFFKSKAVWAMIYAHFCGSWGHYTCLSWLPTFFSEELNLNLTEAAWVSVLPPLGSMIITSIAAPFADNLISNGIDITKVRKICQTIAFLSPATFMMLSSVDLGLPPWEIVAFLTSGLALSSFALSGLYCTHQDISREYASILLGITNTVGAVPGIVGIALTGYLLDTTHSWSISLFAPSIFFYLTGTAVWLAFASSEPQEFSKSELES